MTGSASLDCSTPGVLLQRLRDKQPLVHCLTAAVSMNLVADALLAAGARPMMTETLQEAPHVAGRADALLANLGTLSTDGMAGIPAAVGVAVQRGIGWVLDPAAIGPSALRVQLARGLLARRPSVVRANASEVLVLAGRGSGGRGADASDAPERAVEAARELVARFGCVVAISGAVDLVVGADEVVEVHNGHEMLTRVTGTGCSLGALTAAMCSVAPPLEAAVAATALLGMAGERAAEATRGPGSFRVALLDELHLLAPVELDGAAHLVRRQP